VKVKDLIQILQQHDPEAEVHVCNDRGYYEYVGGAACADQDAWLEEALSKMTEEEEDDPWPDPPECDG
jgi:hypothetical protein